MARLCRLWALQQVGGYPGYIGREAHIAVKAASDPTLTFAPDLGPVTGLDRMVEVGQFLRDRSTHNDGITTRPPCSRRGTSIPRPGRARGVRPCDTQSRSG